MIWMYQNIDCLPTPCGEVVVLDERGQKVPFSLRNNPYNPVYTLFRGTERAVPVQQDTNYLLCLNTNRLLPGMRYRVCLLGMALHPGDSDEHTVSLSGTVAGYSIAIGAYDPNDEEKVRQDMLYTKSLGYKEPCAILPAPQYDESRCRGYMLEQLPDHFAFRLLDQSIKEISFPIAWLRHEYEEAAADYLDAVELWVT